MFKYAFRYNTTERYDFNLSFHSQQLNLGGLPNWKLLRPFGSEDVYQVGNALTQSEPLLLTGFFTKTPENDIVTVSEALKTCDRIFTTDELGGNEAYSDCDGASQPIQVALTHYGHKVMVYFWVTQQIWKLSADDSETVI